MWLIIMPKYFMFYDQAWFSSLKRMVSKTRVRRTVSANKVEFRELTRLNHFCRGIVPRLVKR